MELKRSGYVHALEGLVAAIIVVVYVTSVLSIPETTNWESVEVSKTATDLMSALDRSGFLDRVVMRDDPASFTAYVQALDSSLSYSINLQGLPKTHVDIGVIPEALDTIASETERFEPEGTGDQGLPEAEAYRRGEIDLSGIGTPEATETDFVLSDTSGKGVREFDTVNFDFNGDDDFGANAEGPYTFADRFDCSEISGCGAETIYEVGRFNDTLRVHRADRTASLSRMSNTSIGSRTVELDYETVDPATEPVEHLDVLWVGSADPDDYDAAVYSDVIPGFLERGKLVIVNEEVSRDQVGTPPLSGLGFDYIEAFDIEGETGTHTFYSLKDPRNASYRSSQYYLDSDIRIYDPADGNADYTLTVNGTSIGVIVNEAEGTLALGNQGDVSYSVGDRVLIQGNTYLVERVSPPSFAPTGRQRFASFNNERIDADYHVTRATDATYNITAYDRSASYDSEHQDEEDLPESYGSAVVHSSCEGEESYQENPYRVGDIDMEEDEDAFNFALVNFEPQIEGNECNPYFEFAYVDTDQDGDFKASDDGPFQRGDTVQIQGNNYTVAPMLGGEGINLTRQGPRVVGGVPVSNDVYGGGSVALVGKEELGDDDRHLLASLMAVETQEELSFTGARTVGDTALGYTYLSSGGRETSYGYTLDTVWWFN